METQTLRIAGMFCAHCRDRIEKTLSGLAGIEKATADFKAGTATVAYNPAVLALAEIASAIENLGYRVVDEKDRGRAARVLINLLLILFLYILLQRLLASGSAAAFPLAESGMGYGMVFVIGLITSVHCLAMCGGINLSQCLGAENCRGNPPPSLAALRPAALYNAGRILSYTAVGAGVGALGSVFAVSGQLQGALLLAAGVFMIGMGINMSGIFPALRRFSPRLPFFALKPDGQGTSRHPLIVGFLNGFLPCGPLQAMQLYALSTGSAIAGGMSMFIFCLGTLPLVFGLGALSSMLSRKFARRVLHAGALLVIVLGLIMLGNGWSLAGWRSPAEALRDRFYPVQASKAEGQAFTPVIQNGAQIVQSLLTPSAYPAIVVRQGVPVRWTISAPPGSINGCNNRMFIREYGIEHAFRPGENVIEFTPERTGRFSYSCWMGMIRSSITVVAENEVPAEVQDDANLALTPAGVRIPVEAVAVAARQHDAQSGRQVVGIELRDEGFSPAVVVLQRGVPAVFVINSHSADPGNSTLIVPAYFSRVNMRQGSNAFRLIPEADFDFSTGDHMFYGYAKVVDDVENIDLEAIKKEVAAFETQVYPEAYFDQASGGCACCAGARQ